MTNEVKAIGESGKEYGFLFGTWSKRRFMELSKDFDTIRDDQFTIGQLSIDITLAVVAGGLENYTRHHGQPLAVVTPYEASECVDDLGGEDSGNLKPILEAFNFFNKDVGVKGDSVGESVPEQPETKATEREPQPPKMKYPPKAK